ncbi:ABC transporter permease [Rhizobium sp. TRM95796]|uniref:ABC transporter permease n=1 Tax=Rhizobium sp. TRM95796 TaxID=2979862 RepID=UPI0021E7823D|nr:ABC transporter permease [Rhizobium sp. TRM95796]MCV3767838.1 ABC transporter permease [Rhizobium sp. TRM95796]
MSVDVENYTFTPDVAPKLGPKGGARFAAAALRYGALLSFLAILVIFSVAAPFFLSIFNIGNILGQTAITGVLAIGLTVVVIAGGPNVVTGGIDLSLAANMGLSAAVYASLIQAGYGDGVATLAAMATGLAIGAVNAAAVAGIGIVPLLATLAVMNVVSGLELVLTQNTVIPASSDALTALSSASLFGIPALGYALVGFSLIMGLIIQNTRFGLRLYAVGEFPEAARAAGVPVRSYLAASFLISGLCGGLAGILNTAYLSGSSTGSGEMLLPVVVTALLGSVFSRRLVPTIGGTLLSALFVGVLLNGFQLLNLSSTLVSGVQGVLILLTVSATTLIRREN